MIETLEPIPGKAWSEAKPEKLPDDGCNYGLVGSSKNFFAGGTEIAWIIDPENECAEVCDSPVSRKLIGDGGVVTEEQVMPGFQLSPADLFKPWDWN